MTMPKWKRNFKYRISSNLPLGPGSIHPSSLKRMLKNYFRDNDYRGNTVTKLGDGFSLLGNLGKSIVHLIYRTEVTLNNIPRGEKATPINRKMSRIFDENESILSNVDNAD